MKLPQSSFPHPLSILLIGSMSLVTKPPAQIGGGWEEIVDLDSFAQGTTGNPGKWGFVVASGGDGDGDGSNDFVVGDPYADTFGVEQGRVVCFNGSNGSVAWELIGAPGSLDDNDLFGYSLDAFVDVNHDGLEDVLIGSPGFWDNSNGSYGRVFLFHGNGGLQTTFLPMAGDFPDSFGWAVTFAGDVKGNGGGRGDVAISDPFFLGPGPIGRVWVYQGGGIGTNVPAYFLEGGTGTFGWSLDDAGDINLDGQSDLLVGDPSGVGVAIVYTYPGGLSQGIELREYNPIFDQGGRNFHFGHCVRNVRDLNGDGVEDHAIGAPGGGDIGGGRLYVFSGATGDLLWDFSSGRSGDRLGESIDRTGDVNGDGIPDVIVGAPGGSPRDSEAAGYAFLLSGTDGEVIGRIDGRRLSRLNLGHAVAGTLADYNGDGKNDVLVGGPGLDEPDLKTGNVWLFGGAPQFLSATANTLSVSVGGTIDFPIEFDNAAYHSYKLLISSSGKGPVFIGDLPIPLGFDNFLVDSYLGQTPPGTSAFSGSFDSNSQALARLQTGPLSNSLIGARFYLAAIAGPPWGPWQQASSVILLDLVP